MAYIKCVLVMACIMYASGCNSPDDGMAQQIIKTTEAVGQVCSDRAFVLMAQVTARTQSWIADGTITVIGAPFDNGAVGAFSQCLWSCLMVEDFDSIEKALAVTNLNEICNPGNKCEHTQNIQNCRMGRSFAFASGVGNCQATCFDAAFIPPTTLKLVPPSPENWGCEEGQALVCGDPHFTTFDGLRHHFQGKGWFTGVVMRPLPGDVGTFKLEVLQESCGHWAEKASCLSAVRLVMDDTELVTVYTTAQPERKIKLGNTTDDVYVGVGGSYVSLNFVVEFRQNNTQVYIHTSNGLEAFIRNRGLRVAVSAAYRNSGNVQGILGTFNGNPHDDLTKPDGNVLSYDKFAVQDFAHQEASVPIQEFGNSWAVHTSSDKFSTQADRFIPIVKYTRATTNSTVQLLCGDVVLSHVKKCGKHVHQEEVDHLLTTCYYDLHVCPECYDMVIESTEILCAQD